MPYLFQIFRSKRKLNNFLHMFRWGNPILLSNTFIPKLKFLRRYSSYDLSIIRFLVNQCYLAVDKKTAMHLLANKYITIYVDGNLFKIKCFEDLYHVTLCYEKETLAFIESIVKQDGVFVDVGANIGGYTIRLSRSTHVYAFEPHPDNYSLLCQNLKINNIENVSVYRCAVSDTSGTVNLYTSQYKGRHSLVSSNAPSVEVDAVTLDDLLADQKKIDVLKIDVEGVELSVFRGSINTLRKTRFVVFESSSADHRKSTHRFLTALGFKFVENIDFVNRVYSSSQESMLANA